MNSPLPSPPVNPDHRPVVALLDKCPAHQATPLIELPAGCVAGNQGTVWAKNEAARMGLGSFKALGGSFAILQLLMRKAGISSDELESLDNPALQQAAAGETFICATAGNHGLAVAAASRLFGARAVIHIADSVPESFAERLVGKGAEVVRGGAIYEDALAAAMRSAEDNGWQLIADTSWDEYIEIPAMIYQGYTALAEECRASFEEKDQWPDRVFLQAGVGGMAAAVAAHIREWWPHQPEIVIVEPEAAPCIGRSIAEGKMTTVSGPVSSMGRLDCKEPSLLTFESLRTNADSFVTVTDAEAEEITRDLEGCNLPSTPSGAAGVAALRSWCNAHPERQDGVSLVIVSEGAE